MITKLVNGKRVEMDNDEEALFIQAQEEATAEMQVNKAQRLRDALIEEERKKAVDTLIAADIEVINNLPDAAVEARASEKGLA